MVGVCVWGWGFTLGLYVALRTSQEEPVTMDNGGCVIIQANVVYQDNTKKYSEHF